MIDCKKENQYHLKSKIRSAIFDTLGGFRVDYFNECFSINSNDILKQIINAIRRKYVNMSITEAKVFL
jgi:hypothetical protein